MKEYTPTATSHWFSYLKRKPTVLVPGLGCVILCNFLVPSSRTIIRNKTSKTKTLLILDSVPGNLVNNEDKADNTEDVLMPPNMTSLLQPLIKGV
jgi:hypothetical protein